MTNAKNTLLATLLILGIGDLAMIPFMIAANHRTAGTPPLPAIALGALIGLTTLASLPGVRQDRRWAFRVSIICRAMDTVSSALGILAGPGVGFAVVGGFGMTLSVLAIVLLVRHSPARPLGHATTRA